MQVAEICSSALFSVPGAWLDGFVLVSCGCGQEGCGSSGFFGYQLFKTYSVFFFFFFTCFPVNFECLKESLFLCRLPIQGGDLVLSISFGLVPGSQSAWRSLPSPSKRGKEEFGGEEILSCLFCICISALWHFLQKEPGDSRRGVWGQSQGSKAAGEAAPRR